MSAVNAMPQDHLDMIVRGFARAFEVEVSTAFPIMGFFDGAYYVSVDPYVGEVVLSRVPLQKNQGEAIVVSAVKWWPAASDDLEEYIGELAAQLHLAKVKDVPRFGAALLGTIVDNSETVDPASLAS